MIYMKSTPEIAPADAARRSISQALGPTSWVVTQRIVVVANTNPADTTSGLSAKNTSPIQAPRGSIPPVAAAMRRMRRGEWPETLSGAAIPIPSGTLCTAIDRARRIPSWCSV
jgi:hypothetical protein